jgi:hypothetical protein
MIPLSIGRATEVYGDASECEITRHWVDHPALADFSRSLRALIQSLGDEATDEYWRNTLGSIRRLAFAFCSTPLPFTHAAALVGTDWGKVNRQVRLCQQLYPDSHEALGSLVQNLELLSAESSSPLIGPLTTLLRQNGGLSVVMRNPRMNQAVAAYFSANPDLRNAKVVSAAQLRGARLGGVLAAIGPCGWFPEYVFSAPRAPAIHVISFRWIRDSWKPEPVFLNNSDVTASESRNHRVGEMPRIGGESAGNNQSSSDILPADVLPPLPIFARRALPGTASEPDSGAETVPSRLCHLSGNRAVFVAADDGASSLIIDTSEMGNAVVRRAPADELEAGLYVLLRTSGGGDFIAPLADRILGELAGKRRLEQTEWKDRLIAKAVEKYGAISRRELSSLICFDRRTPIAFRH